MGACHTTRHQDDLPLFIQVDLLKMFRHTIANHPLDGRLVYIPEEFSLDTINRKILGVTSVLVNDIQIEISIDRLAIAIWGACPHPKWKKGKLNKPISQIGKLWFDGDFTPGVSIRVTKSGEYWPVTFDPTSGWIHLGKERLADDQTIEFVEGCIVVLRDDEIVGLWLHPDYQRGNIE